MADLAAVAAAFGQRLHDAGVPVTPERSARFAQAVALVEPGRLADLYWTGRVCLLTEPSQLATFDRAFAAVFRGIVDAGQPAELPMLEREPTGGTSRDRSGNDGAEPSGGRAEPVATSASPLEPSPPDDPDGTPPVLAATSADERLRDADFAACSPDELALIAELVERLPLVPPRRPARRSRRHRSGDRLDMRATLAESRRTGGDPVRAVRRRRTDRPRRVVLIADVSGSMAPYARIYLHLMRGAVRGVGAEAFVFTTRLTRLTRVLSAGVPDVAYRGVARAAPDWSGGTRIGAALTQFLDDHGRRGVARGAVVVIVSDGWEIGSAVELAEAMRRLRLLAHHVIWVNPRKAGTAFQPLAGGMAAALPYVDTFVSGHSARAVDEVLDAIRATPPRRSRTSRAETDARQAGKP